ncbi:pyridoxamine 5'-phosphate oxidase-domain-containing protein [Phlyctochytrium arcticum]|nr:pyridoxamine 5'-phosphate oxidase-domain-containing protein [Phlyctochytrium arcticum]
MFFSTVCRLAPALFLIHSAFSPLAAAGVVPRDEHTPSQAAPLARELVATVTLGEVATTVGKGVKEGIEGFPFSTPEYIADDCPSSGQPLLYFVTWGTHARNVRLDPRASVSIRHPNFTLTPPESRGRLDEARVSLVGELEQITDAEEAAAARECFTKAHPDTPHTFPHRSAFYRLNVHAVRWIGGFGDRHYNGWVPAETYLNAKAGGVSATSPAHAKPVFDHVRVLTVQT